MLECNSQDFFKAETCQREEELYPAFSVFPLNLRNPRKPCCTTPYNRSSPRCVHAYWFVFSLTQTSTRTALTSAGSSCVVIKRCFTVNVDLRFVSTHCTTTCGNRRQTQKAFVARSHHERAQRNAKLNVSVCSWCSFYSSRGNA